MKINIELVPDISYGAITNNILTPLRFPYNTAD